MFVANPPERECCLIAIIKYYFSLHLHSNALSNDKNDEQLGRKGFHSDVCAST